MLRLFAICGIMLAIAILAKGITRIVLRRYRKIPTKNARYFSIAGGLFPHPQRTAINPAQASTTRNAPNEL